MEYCNIEETARKWGVSIRSVQILCAGGKIDGAMRFGRAWMIPSNAQKPPDGRTRAGRLKVEEDMPLPRKTPFLYMTDLYSTPGDADTVPESLSFHHEAKVLFEAQVAYSRGQIDRVYEKANYLLEKHSGFYAVISAGMLLAMCSIWQGDIEMWRNAKIHIAQAPAADDFDRDLMQLAISAVDIMLYNVTNFPEWFQVGSFELLQPDSLPAAKVYYAKYLYALGYSVASNLLQMEGIQGLALMSMLPNTLEPLISWAKAEKSLIAEIYLRLTCATVYHNSGNDAQAIRHIDRAISMALPDRLYGLLAEYCRVLYSLMEQRLCLVDGEVWERVKALYRGYNLGWSKLSGAIRGKTLITTLSVKEREVAKLAAFGMSNQQIADKLHLSLSVVKQSIRIVMEKSGMARADFAAIL